MNETERIAALQERREIVPHRPERLWAKNEFRVFDVYRVPTDLLVLNPANQRLRPERLEFESELDRAFDPLANPDDEASIISLLLDRDWHLEGERVVGTPNKDTRALIADWERRKQERPLWIRPDGIVRNGNRRLAMLRRLQIERGREGFDWVDVIFLPHDEFDDDDLFDMEAREQLTEGLKVRYSDLALLLTLRDAADREGVDWDDPDSITDVASRIQHLVGSNPRYAQLQLWAVKYMADYLEHVGRPDEYHRLKRSVERFRDVGQNMMYVRREAPERDAEMLEACFAAVSSGRPHGHIREMRIILSRDPVRFEALVQELREVEDEAGSEEEEVAPVSIPDPAAEDEDEEESDEEEESSATPDPDYPVHAGARVIDLHVLNSRGARAERDAQRDVRHAAALLEAIDPTALVPHLGGRQGERLTGAIQTIIAWADRAREAAKLGQT